MVIALQSPAGIEKSSEVIQGWWQMLDLLSKAECDTIMDALKHYKMHVENYNGFASYEFKREQLARIEAASEKIRILQTNTE